MMDLRPARLQRLRSMSFAEIAYRSRQEAAKALERLAPAGRVTPPDTALDIIRRHAPARFFAGASDAATAETMQARFPDECQRILTTADAALSGRFDLLGYRGLAFGTPIDWHLDPVWGRRAPLRHWSRLDPLDAAAIGDSKVVWELNRQQWLVRVAQAWVVTRETRYAAACVETIDAWLRENPAGQGINWSSSLEVSFRLMSWSWTMLLIRDWPGLSTRAAREVLAAIWQHAVFVRRYLSYYFSPNTHLTGEALGLLHAGVVFPVFAEAADWRTVALRVLREECQRQVRGDGVHFEQATCYQRYTADTYLTLLILAGRAGIPLPRGIGERTARMAEVLAAVTRPDGTMPAIGDTDGGRLLPITERASDDARGTLAVAAALFARADLAWAAGGVAPELVWLFGREGLRRFDALTPRPTAAALQVFPSGYAVMRSGSDKHAHHLIADAGPLGCSTSSGHGHADLASVQLSIFGDPVLVDPGTGCYTPEPLWRDYFRSTAAHSTVRIDGVDHAEPAGTFRWKHRPSARFRGWTSDTAADVLDIEHDAYLRLADPVKCRRRIAFVKPDYWLVVDDLEGAERHRVEINFQFAPDVHVAGGLEPWIRVATRGGHTLWMLPMASSPLETVISCGELDPPHGWVSAAYGQREPAPAVRFTTEAALPWRAMTLLVPVAGTSSEPPAVIEVRDAHGRPSGVRFGAAARSAHVDDDTVVVA